jgi:hypothetical protein
VHDGPDELPQNAVLHQIEQKHLQVGSGFGLSQWIVVSSGHRNHLIEGVSGTGKTSVCKELQRRGHHAINGDTELAYQGDPETGKPTDGSTHEHHIWYVDRVKALVANQHVTGHIFCGGSRNFPNALVEGIRLALIANLA